MSSYLSYLPLVIGASQWPPRTQAVITVSRRRKEGGRWAGEEGKRRAAGGWEWAEEGSEKGKERRID